MTGWIKSALMLALCTALLAWPLIVNRGPIPFNDTFPYLTAGNKVWSTASKLLGIATSRAPSGPATNMRGEPVAPGERAAALGGRSPYYGAFAAAAAAFSGFTGVALVQALWLALVLLMAFRPLGIAGWWRLAVVALLTLTTSLGFFTAVIMPDVCAGVAVLALALLAFWGRAMTRLEWAFWAANLLFAALSHTAMLVLATGTLGLLLILPRGTGVRVAPAALVLGVAALGTLAIGVLVARLTDRSIVPIPFLLARVMGDGTGAQVLRDDCPLVHYVSCKFLPALPITENDFLWDTVIVTPWAQLSDAERIAMTAEQKPILTTVLTRYPLEQARASLGNFKAQLVELDLSRFGRHDYFQSSILRDFADDLRVYRATLNWQGRFPLVQLTSLWFGLYAAAALAGFALLATYRWWRREGGDDARIAVAATLLVSLAVSAATTGIFAGVIGRYQARISWVAMFALIVLVAALVRARRRDRARH